MTASHDLGAVALAAAWGGADRVDDLGGPVHWVDFGGPARGADRPPIVLVHGLGGSHLNWVAIAPDLARVRRTVALDLAGFGLTPAAGRSTGVRANAVLLGRFVDEVVGGPAVLVGNSMGGMISALLTAQRPDLVAGLGLVDPSLPLLGWRQDPRVAAQFAMFAVPFVGEGYLRRNNRRLPAETRVRRTLALCFADTARVDAEIFAADVALTGYRAAIPGTEAAFTAAARSILAILGRSSRYAAQLAALERPVLLVHGEADRLVPIAAARAAVAASPRWRHEFLPGTGHVPQLERPDRVAPLLLDWLEELPG